MMEGQRDTIDQLVGSERDEYIEDLVLQAGVLAEMEHDPLAVACAEAQHKASRFGLTRYSKRWVFDPPLAFRSAEAMMGEHFEPGDFR